jgi:hypothetical protein
MGAVNVYLHTDCILFAGRKWKGMTLIPIRIKLLWWVVGGIIMILMTGSLSLSHYYM